MNQQLFKEIVDILNKPKSKPRKLRFNEIFVVKKPKGKTRGKKGNNKKK